MSAGAAAPVLVDRPAEGVLRLRLDRPRARNALDAATVSALSAGLAGAGDARAVVLGSAAPAMFCAGADLKLPDAERAEVSDALYALYEQMVSLPVPLVAAVEGDAVGGGAQLAAACDLRVLAPAARIRFAGPGHGLAVGPWALRSLVGRGRAADLCLTMRWVPAPEALAIGLADRVADDPAGAAVALAADLARLDPGAVERTKRLLAGEGDGGALTALRAERAGNRAAWSGSTRGLVSPT